MCRSGRFTPGAVVSRVGGGVVRFSSICMVSLTATFTLGNRVLEFGKAINRNRGRENDLKDQGENLTTWLPRCLDLRNDILEYDWWLPYPIPVRARRWSAIELPCVSFVRGFAIHIAPQIPACTLRKRQDIRRVMQILITDYRL
jgi:hypothetical protein